MSESLLLSNQVIPTDYHYKLTINHLKPNFSGEAIIQWKNTSDDSTGFSLTLHASKLVITSATIGDIKLKITYDKQNQRVSFTTEEAITESNLVLKYMGQIKTISTYKDATQGLFKTNYLDDISGKANNYIIATHFQPHSAKSVFPIIDEIQHKPNVQLDIITDTKFKVLTNGKLTNQEYVNENTLHQFKYDLPISPSVMGFVIGDLEYISSESLSVPTRIYTCIGESKYARFALSTIEKYLPVLEQKFHHSYPLSKLDFVTIPFLNDGAMENWGLVTVIPSTLLVDELNATVEQKKQVVELVVHELVHQWVGNWVTFDDWNSLWFNESFATWATKIVAGYSVEYEEMLDKDCFYVDDKFTIQSIHEHVSTVYTGLNATTSSIFDTNAYEKGIILLNMIYKVFKSEGKDLIECFGKFVIDKYKGQSIKVFDIWQQLNECVSIDLPSFFYSWTRLHGYPLVRVSYSRDQLHIEQHTYLYNIPDLDKVGIEDAPFHIPLLIRVVDDKKEVKTLNVLLTDRSLDLDIPKSQLININSGRGGYYRVLYNELTNINLMTSSDLIGVLHDLGKLLGTQHSTSKDLAHFFDIMELFVQSSWKWDWKVMKVALTYLTKFQTIFTNYITSPKFQSWLSKYASDLFQRINWDKVMTGNYSRGELDVYSTILDININNKHAVEFATRHFSQFINPTQKTTYVPGELLGSIFNLSMSVATMKQYKQVLALVKNSNTSLLKHTNLLEHELQTVAISSLAYPTSQELLRKTLNFVHNNIDSKMIELAVVGITNCTDNARVRIVFDWFKLNYDNWVLRSLRKGSDWSKQIGVTVKNLATLILELMHRNQQFEVLRVEFIESKRVALPEHGLHSLNEELEHEREEKLVIVSFLEDIKQRL
ncbi:uncharacterized protein SPAPADRAFT_73236 [Spathaspora passalidarum NRRL Y-27907]|uniref:Aminopeptidase n=1 Tax=Spathaspora passalidarum (strain NRRL Y-27907 / 11-Y1) TaxID=619300 RepID=G3AUI0_SPAPN|nr:uncharacterized protein SPAPADRAFT_73236 [Spathaspora passalidarum NRRL Y-27907]EGW30536.1 hypothetical protein SPAPADRAFT_73236 [Spathaspora passalidarum NRRL Y-27907]